MPQSKLKPSLRATTRKIRGGIVNNTSQRNLGSRFLLSQKCTTLKGSQSGNVFIVIMLGVFLFGSLMYMFSRSAQQGTGNITKQQAKVAAQEILNYARLVEGAVNRVRRNGCSETEISFANDVVAGYEHTPPARNECKIFHDEGGKMSWASLPAPYANNDSPVLFSGKYFYMSSSWIGNGTDCNDSRCADLVLLVSMSDESLCDEINNLLNYSSMPVESQLGGNTFTGAYSWVAAHTIGNEASSSEIIGKSTGCLQRNTGYIFLHVLLAR